MDDLDALLAEVEAAGETTPLGAGSSSTAGPASGERRGTCAICGKGVWTSQARDRDERGRYVHMACLQRQSRRRSAQSEGAPEWRGTCTICGKAVFSSQPRLRDKSGARGRAGETLSQGRWIAAFFWENQHHAPPAALALH